MADSRFDSISKGLASRLNRRTAIRSGSGLVGGLALGAAASTATPAAAQSTPAASPVASAAASAAASPVAGAGDNAMFLFVQTGGHGTFVPNPDAGTPTADATATATPTPGGGAPFLLTLEGHTGGTIYFSDRPERVFGDAPTAKFLDGLGFSAGNPPNAALVTRSATGDEDVAVMELFAPHFDATNGTLSYGANILSGYQGDGLAFAAERQQDDALPAEFASASLFIDDCADQTWGCYPRTGDNPNGAVGYVTTGACWSWETFSCDWSNCKNELDPDSRCNQSGFDCGDYGCLACTTSPLAVAEGEGGECL
ncbi:MAG TPA: hypothetical protein VNP95_06990 [Thermomicrobiales bacterium]|nr:hypothetical protein [Thermomicrobiales bacterium]